MNIDAKILSKQIQQNTLKVIYQLSSGIYPRNAGIFQYLQIYQCDTLDQQIED